MAGTKKSTKKKAPTPSSDELFESGHFAARIEESSGIQEVADNHREYGNTVNSERAVPNICDGLLGVQRYCLWTSKDLHMSTDKLMGSAEFVGSSMRFHPHADTSLYDSMTRMTQPDRHNIPLFGFQGDNGSMEMGHAALRYTYVKPSAATLAMLGQDDPDSVKGEIDYGGVPMVPNFNKKYLEPAVLPAMIPAYLTNGHGDGLGVGVAAHIPKHNLTEVLDLALHLLKLGSPNIRTSTLTSILPGPDFPKALPDDPQGLDIFDTAAGGLESYLTTGRGSFIMQATYHVEEYRLSRKETGRRIVFDQLPYGVKHDKVKDAFDKMVESGKIPPTITYTNSRHPVADIGAFAVEDVLPYLYAFTPLRQSFSVNMAANVPDEGSAVQGASPEENSEDAVEAKPPMHTEKSVSAVLAIMEWLDHRRRTIRRASARKVEVFSAERANLDLTLLAIRHAKWLTQVSLDNDEPAPIVADKLDISETDAQYILDHTTFSRLSQRRRDGILAKIKTLTTKIDFHNSIVGSNEVLDKELARQIKATRKQFGHPRSCTIHSHEDDDFVAPKGPMVKVPPKKGFLAVSERGSIRWCLRDNIARSTGSDYFSRLIPATAADSMYAVSSSGQVWRMPVADVPKEPTRITLHMVNAGLDIDQSDRILGLFTDSELEGRNLALLTDGGRLKAVDTDKLLTGRNGAKEVVTLDPAKESEVVAVAPFNPGDTLGVLTSEAMFSLHDTTDVKAKGLKARATAFVRRTTRRGAGAAGDGSEFIWFGVVDDSATEMVYRAGSGFARFPIDRKTDTVAGPTSTGSKVSKLSTIAWCRPSDGSGTLCMVSSENPEAQTLAVADLKPASRDATVRRTVKIEGAEEVYATTALIPTESEE